MHVVSVLLQIAVISVFVVRSNTSVQSVKQRLSSDGLSMALKHCRTDSVHERNVETVRTFERPNRIQVVAVRADHRPRFSKHVIVVCLFQPISKRIRFAYGYQRSTCCCCDIEGHVTSHSTRATERQMGARARCLDSGSILFRGC